MDATSPTKRRAALATLDANAKTTTTPASHKPTALPMSGGGNKRRSALLSSAPVLAPPVAVASSTPSVGTKRSGMVLSDAAEQDGSGQREVWEEMEGSPVFKKSRLDNAGEYLVSGGNDDGNNESNESNNGGNNESNNNNDGQGAAHSQPASTQGSSARSRTHSPDASSVFDASGAEDATWVTTATEPDAAAAVMPVAPVVRPRAAAALTREQAREKAEILRLRLGLASYKLRTGQISIPLADLQARPLQALAAASTSADAGAGADVVRTVENTPESSQGVEGEAEAAEDGEDVVAATPPAVTTQ